MALEIVEAVEEAVNEAFPPKPGGLVDRARQKAALQEARKEEEKNAAERVEQASFRAVKTAQESPELFAITTYVIAAGGNAMILPGNQYRYRATIAVVTTGGTVVYCKDQGAAVSQNGFPWTAALPPLPLFGRGQLWAANTGGASVQVAVISEMYAPEVK